MVALLLPLLASSFSLRMMSTTSVASTSSIAFEKPVVQYIFVRRDLQGWPPGAVAAQVAHASVAAIVEGTKAQDPATLHYTDNLLHMTKYVYGVDSLDELEGVKAKWGAKFGDTYHCWMEEPEHIPTAIATWPLERTNPVSKLVKNLKVSFF